MSDISKHLTFRNDRPIDDAIVALTKAILNAASHEAASVMLVGARARDFLLQHIHGLDVRRATTDMDFAFALNNWEQFEAVKNSLLATHGFSASAEHVQRIHYVEAGEPHPIAVDLIPFGEIASDRQRIAWPPDMQVVMSVAGYDDALRSALQVQIAPDVRLTVASLPGLMLLKLFAWSERRNESHKDAIDLATLLRSYHEAGNLERIYEEATQVLESVDYDVEMAGAWLLGHDVAKVASPEIHAKLNDLLFDRSLRDHLMLDITRGLRDKTDAEAHASWLLRRFSAGLMS